MKSEAELLLDQWMQQSERRVHDAKLLKIYEGNLKDVMIDYIKVDMPKTWQHLVSRLAPINVLQRLIDKLSKIYQQSVIRSPEKDNPNSISVLSYYEKNMEANVYFNIANELFNLTKGCILWPFVHNGKPRMRVIPSDSFLAYSNDPVDNTIMTHLLLPMGKHKDKDIYHLWTDNEFKIIDGDGKIQGHMMDELGFIDAINPIGQIPGIYCKRSRRKLVPEPDSDLLQMAIILPLLISDLNYSVKWQAFAITLLINLSANNLTRDAGVFWELHTDPENPEANPDVKTVKPEIDIEPVLNLAAEQLGLWLQTQGIKPGAIGRANVENFSSGISKMIDEMDTHENRLVQVGYFKKYEKEFWDLTLNKLHPYWLGQKKLLANQWGGGLVDTKFPKQLPMESRITVLDEIKKAMDQGLMTKIDAIRRLHPEWNDKEAESYLIEIEDERKANLERQREYMADGRATESNDTNTGANEGPEGNASERNS